MPKGQYERKNAFDRIREYVSIHPATGCWIWTKHCDKDGYGQVSEKSKTKHCHRVAYEAVKGEIPDGQVVGHLCDEKYPFDSKEYRKCCNPDHLTLCTNKENIQRAVELGRYVITSGAFKKGEGCGETNLNAKLKDEQIIEMRRKYEEGFAYGQFKKYASDLGVAYITCQKYCQKHSDGSYKKRPELLP